MKSQNGITDTDAVAMEEPAGLHDTPAIDGCAVDATEVDEAVQQARDGQRFVRDPGGHRGRQTVESPRLDERDMTLVLSRACPVDAEEFIEQVRDGCSLRIAQLRLPASVSNWR